MSLLKVRAKVRIASEEQMEVEAKYDLGKISKRDSEDEWVWRNIAIPFEDVYRIVEHSQAKCVIVMYETDENILVAEKFDSLYERWDLLRKEFGDFQRKINKNTETSSEEGDV